MKKIINNIKNKFTVENVKYQRDNLTFITVEKSLALEVLTYLRDFEKFTHLVLLTAVDWLEDGKFQLTYLLNNPQSKTEIGVRVFISRDNATMTTSHHLWPALKTYQKELKEMFGIDFPNSPEVDEGLVLEGWDGPPPYRRDFDTKEYSEATYFPREGRVTYDPAEYMKKKLYPED